MSIVGISGRAGSGKDAFATMLLESLASLERDITGKDPAGAFKRYRFADPLKHTVCEMFGWTPEQIEDRVFKETIDPLWGFTPRRAMQLLGTEFGRALHPGLWLKFADNAYCDALSEGHDGLILTDCRFENEAEWIRERDGVVIHIIRPDGMEVGNPEHASEVPVAQDMDDLVVYNDGTLLDLKNHADHIAQIINDQYDLFGLLEPR